MIGSKEGVWRATARGTQGDECRTPCALVTELSPSESSREAQILYEKGVSSMEKRRGELERGTGGDHDLPYRFTLPTSAPQVLAWVKLLMKVQNGELRP